MLNLVYYKYCLPPPLSFIAYIDNLNSDHLLSTFIKRAYAEFEKCNALTPSPIRRKNLTTAEASEILCKICKQKDPYQLYKRMVKIGEGYNPKRSIIYIYI